MDEYDFKTSTFTRLIILNCIPNYLSYLIMVVFPIFLIGSFFIFIFHFHFFQVFFIFIFIFSGFPHFFREVWIFTIHVLSVQLYFNGNNLNCGSGEGVNLRKIRWLSWIIYCFPEFFNLRIIQLHYSLIFQSSFPCEIKIITIVVVIVILILIWDKCCFCMNEW